MPMWCDYKLSVETTDGYFVNDESILNNVKGTLEDTDWCPCDDDGHEWVCENRCETEKLVDLSRKYPDIWFCLSEKTEYDEYYGHYKPCYWYICRGMVSYKGWDPSLPREENQKAILNHLEPIRKERF